MNYRQYLVHIMNYRQHLVHVMNYRQYLVHIMNYRQYLVHVKNYHQYLVLVTAARHNHSVGLQVAKKLLRDVVLAEGILEGQKELVLFVDHLEARVVRAPGAFRRRAAPVGVHADVFSQQLDVVLALAERGAVADEPGGELGLLGHNLRVVLLGWRQSLGQRAVQVHNVRVKPASVSQPQRERVNERTMETFMLPRETQSDNSRTADESIYNVVLLQQHFYTVHQRIHNVVLLQRHF